MTSAVLRYRLEEFASDDRKTSAQPSLSPSHTPPHTAYVHALMRTPTHAELAQSPTQPVHSQRAASADGSTWCWAANRDASFGASGTPSCANTYEPLRLYYVCVCVCVCVRACVRARACVCARVRVCRRVYVYVYLYISIELTRTDQEGHAHVSRCRLDLAMPCRTHARTHEGPLRTHPRVQP